MGKATKGRTSSYQMDNGCPMCAANSSSKVDESTPLLIDIPHSELEPVRTQSNLWICIWSTLLFTLFLVTFVIAIYILVQEDIEVKPNLQLLSHVNKLDRMDSPVSGILIVHDIDAHNKSTLYYNFYVLDQDVVYEGSGRKYLCTNKKYCKSDTFVINMLTTSIADGETWIIKFCDYLVGRGYLKEYYTVDVFANYK